MQRSKLLSQKHKARPQFIVPSSNTGADEDRILNE